MPISTLLHFLRTYGRPQLSGRHHHQRAHACILVTLLLFALAAHMDALDVAVETMLSDLGTDCSWCAIAPY